jgi:hypothetical protein
MNANAKEKKVLSLLTALTTLTLVATLACNVLGGQSTGNGSNGDLVFAGCYAPNATTGNVDCGLASTFGDPNSDAAVQAEAANQYQFWNGIPATVYPWNDCSGPNAVSLPAGDILYGVSLFQQLVAAYGGDAAPISGVLAHEWGHQVQFDNGWSMSSEPTSRPIELEADAFSGFYMALGESYSWTSINNYFSAVASEGDYNFTDPSHHGTPQERLAAAQLGFQTAIEAIETQTPLTYADLHQIFSTAIAGFDENQVRGAKVSNPVANTFLAHLDRQQILDILNGVSHGREASVPNLDNRQYLYPRK